MSPGDRPAPRDAALQQLRHDLLNPLNVLLGTTGVLLQSELTEAQRAYVRSCRSGAERLLDIVNRLESYVVDDDVAYDRQPAVEGRVRLVDLCSIAAARIDKPFDRETLVGTIEQLLGRRPAKLLLVDDSPDIGGLVRAFLKGTPYAVDVVDDGERAVAQATSEKYDVVLMDIELPGMDGASAAHAIRAADLARGASPTPVVALSAFGAGMPPLEQEPAAAADPGPSTDPEIAPLIPEFLANRRADAETIRASLARGDFARIQTLGHRMKGSGRGYGFQTISRLGADLEFAAQTQDATRIEQLARDLEEYLAVVNV